MRKPFLLFATLIGLLVLSSCQNSGRIADHNRIFKPSYSRGHKAHKKPRIHKDHKSREVEQVAENREQVESSDSRSLSQQVKPVYKPKFQKIRDRQAEPKAVAQDEPQRKGILSESLEHPLVKPMNDKIKEARELLRENRKLKGKMLEGSENNQAATTGLILGVCALVLFPPIAYVGIFFSISGMNQIKNDPDRYSENSRSIAAIGLIFNIIGMITTLLFILVFVWLVSIFSSSY